MSTFFHDGITFNYEIIGEGEPLIVLHGLGGDLQQPKGLIDPIDGYSLIVMDQRAHGKTDITDFQTMTFGHMAEDVIALADHLGIRKFTVGGISMGAAVSVKLALDYPEQIKKVILIRCAWIDEPMGTKIREWYRTVAEYLSREGGLSEYKKTDSFQQVYAEAPKTAETFERLFREEASLKYPEKYLVVPSQKPLEKLNELERLQMPVLILSNHNDPVHVYEYGKLYSQHLKHGEFHEITSKLIDGQKHREEVNQYIRAFLVSY